MRMRSSLPEMPFADLIAWVIGQAHEAGRRGRREEAVEWFSLCRTLLTTRSAPAALAKKVDAEFDAARADADRVRAALMARASPEAATRVSVIGDSLGLPRPEEMADLPTALDATYSARILARLQAAPALGGAAVDAHCQRFFTTDDAVDLMLERPEAIEGAHVLVHLGLNDCAVRMFLTDQRLACALLPKAVSDEVVGFARTYRADIVRAFPAHQYVPLDRLRANLHRMAELTRQSGGLSLTVATVIVVPMKFWHGTPDICRNFTAYNHAIMEEAARSGARVLDVDRLMWQHGNAATLNKDGMHLSARGHALLADFYVKAVFNV